MKKIKGIVFYKNGRYKPLKRKTKTGKAEFILVELTSSLYGKGYIKLDPAAYRKLNKMSNIVFSYQFLNGNTEDDMVDDLWVTHKYYYKSFDEFLAKISEIIITEDILNEKFWVRQCSSSYIFDNLKIKYSTKNTRNTYTNLAKFYKDNKVTASKVKRPSDIVSKIITCGNKKYRCTDKQKGLKDTMSFIYYGDGLYFKVDNSFFDINNMKYSSDVLLNELNVLTDSEYEEKDSFEDEDTTIVKRKVMNTDGSYHYEYDRCYREEHLVYNYINNKSDNKAYNYNFVCLLDERFSKRVIEEIDLDDNGYMVFKAVTKIKQINKHKPKSKSIKKLIAKYFPDIPETL